MSMKLSIFHNFSTTAVRFAVISGYVSVINNLKSLIFKQLPSTTHRKSHSSLFSSPLPQSRCRRGSRHHYRGSTQHLRSRLRAHEEQSQHGITHSLLTFKKRRSHQRCNCKASRAIPEKRLSRQRNRHKSCEEWEIESMNRNAVMPTYNSNELTTHRISSKRSALMW